MVAHTCHPTGRRLRQEEQRLVKNLKPVRPQNTEVQSSFMCLSLRFSVFFCHPSILPYGSLVSALTAIPECLESGLISGGAPHLSLCPSPLAPMPSCLWCPLALILLHLSGCTQGFPTALPLLTLGIFSLWVHLVHAIFRSDLSATDLSRTYHVPESKPEIPWRAHTRPGWKTVCVRYMWEA